MYFFEIRGEIMIIEEKVVVLYLEDWQKRMLKDFLNVDCDSWTLTFEEGLKVMYGSPVIRSVEYKRMYLTDWQMREVRDEIGITCDFVELKKDVDPILKYGLPPNKTEMDPDIS